MVTVDDVCRLWQPCLMEQDLPVMITKENPLAFEAERTSNMAHL